MVVERAATMRAGAAEVTEPARKSRRPGPALVVWSSIVLFGVLFALQGFGVVGGSPMSNTTTWSIIGPITALVGIAIAVGAARRRKP